MSNFGEFPVNLDEPGMREWLSQRPPGTSIRRDVTGQLWVKVDPFSSPAAEDRTRAGR